jgi:hypothetical protein
MILILFSWIIMFYFFLTMGVAAEFVLKIKSENRILSLFLGIITQTILLTIVSFFNSIGLEIFVCNLILTTTLALFFKNNLVETLRYFKNTFASFSVLIKLILIVILLSVLLKCQQFPFILDNESYYIQTIKWLNEYGLVKGLGNLNIAYAQTSAWHILQAGFNFSFITSRLNDINGLLLVICSFYSLSIFDSYLKEENQLHWMGFLMFFNVIIFQFINAPSPDVPLFLLAQIVFYLFVQEQKSLTDIKIISLIFLYLVFIKITILPVGLLFLFLFYKEKKGLMFFLLTSFFTFTLWALKNYILSGYFLFPFDILAIDCDWLVPSKLVNNLNDMIKNHEFLAVKNYQILSLVEKFIIWIQFKGIDSIFNKGIILLFLITPFTKNIQSNNNYKLLYLTILFFFIIVFIISPQFRFFLAAFLFLSTILLSDIFNRLKIQANTFLTLLLVAVLLPLITNYIIDLKSLTSNKLNQQADKISVTQLLLPEQNSKYENISFVKYRVDNLQFYSPKNNFFFYGTANGPLPCTNVRIINRFKRKLKIIPQLRTGKLKDGFYSKKVTND